MAYNKITAEALLNKGVLGLPDTPGLDTYEMQAKFEEVARDVIIPAFNALVDTLTNDMGNIYSKKEADTALDKKMTASEYDSNNDGVVNKAEDANKLGGNQPSYYAAKTAVDTAQTTADEALELAEAAMPKASRPAGSYTGNGSASKRTIDTGVGGKMLFIRKSNGNSIVLVTDNVSVIFSESGASYVANVDYHDGIITMYQAIDSLNASGSTYYWYVLA